MVEKRILEVCYRKKGKGGWADKVSGWPVLQVVDLCMASSSHKHCRPGSGPSLGRQMPLRGGQGTKQPARAGEEEGESNCLLLAVQISHLARGPEDAGVRWVSLYSVMHGVRALVTLVSILTSDRHR